MQLCLGLTLVMLVVSPASAFNSLVSMEDIATMRRLGVSNDVIEFLVENQTVSIGSQEVIRMKKAGLTNNAIKRAIQSDLKNANPIATAIQEAKLIDTLKKTGMSDEAILQFLQAVKSQRRIGSDGRIVNVYSSTTKRPPYAAQGAVLPELKNYGYNPRDGNYYIIKETNQEP